MNRTDSNSRELSNLVNEWYSKTVKKSWKKASSLVERDKMLKLSKVNMLSLNSC